MVDDPLFVRDLAYVIGAALVGGVLAWLARQPLILGYVVGGIIIGPFTPGPTVSDVHTFELFAEVAVVLLMFSIGIEFSLRDLLRVKWIAVVGGPLGIVLSIALSLVVGSALGWPGPQAIAVGAILAGLIVNGSAHAHQTLLRLLPIRDIFVALFFVTVGALIDPAALVSHWRLVTVLVAMIVIGKFVIWTPIVRAFRYPWATAVSVGIGLGQIGEFSFVLVQVARSAGQVGDDLYQATLAASVLTILINGIGVKISLRRLAWR